MNPTLHIFHIWSHSNLTKLISLFNVFCYELWLWDVLFLLDFYYTECPSFFHKTLLAYSITKNKKKDVIPTLLNASFEGYKKNTKWLLCTMPHKHRLPVCVIISPQNCYIINFSFTFLNCNKYVANSLHRRKFSFHSSSQVKFRWRDTWRSIIGSNGHLTIDVSVDQINDLSYSLCKRIK